MHRLASRMLLIVPLAVGLALPIGCGDPAGREGGAGQSAAETLGAGAASAPDASVDTSASHDGGTGADGGAVDGPAISFAGHVKPIFARTCTGYCHPGGYAPMSLEPQVAWNNLVNAPSSSCANRARVTPLNATASGSNLMSKLTGEELCGGGMMPPGGRLPDEDIATIRAWIQQGALDN